MTAYPGIPQIRSHLRRDTSWQEEAACTGHDAELWFEKDPTQALRICGLCPAQVACAQYAADIGASAGVWGGVERNLPAAERYQRPPRHGTEARARWDQRRSIKPCQACRDAAARAHQARRHTNAAVTEKACKTCGVTKPGREFYAKAGTRDGLAPYCKPCQRERYQNWYRRNGRALRGRA